MHLTGGVNLATDLIQKEGAEDKLMSHNQFHDWVLENYPGVYAGFVEPVRYGPQGSVERAVQMLRKWPEWVFILMEKNSKQAAT